MSEFRYSHGSSSGNRDHEVSYDCESAVNGLERRLFAGGVGHENRKGGEIVCTCDGTACAVLKCFQMTEQLDGRVLDKQHAPSELRGNSFIRDEHDNFLNAMRSCARGGIDRITHAKARTKKL